MSSPGLFPSEQLLPLSPLPDLWPAASLKFTQGNDLLSNIGVFHDFEWESVFGHNKAMFRRGLRLALSVKEQCPEGKTPLILLTITPGKRWETHHTQKHFVVVIRIHEYLKFDSDPSAAFFLDAGTLTAIQQVEANPVAVRELLDRKLDEESLKEWLASDSERQKLLSKLVSSHNSSPTEGDDFNDLLRRLANSEFSTEQLTDTVELLAEQNHLEGLVQALARKADSLKLVGLDDDHHADRIVAAALRVSHRKAALAKLDTLIAENPEEKFFQKLLDENWWMLGSHYVRRIEKRHWTSEDTLDILLQTADGFYDLIELKRAIPDPFKDVHGRPGVVAEVNDAVNQGAHYVAQLEKLQSYNKDEFDIDMFRLNVKVLIGVIDDNDPLADKKRKSLRMYNSHLHRIQVITYDELRRTAAHVIEANEGEIDFVTALPKEKPQASDSSADGYIPPCQTESPPSETQDDDPSRTLSNGERTELSTPPLVGESSGQSS